MGYHHVDPSALDPVPDRPGTKLSVREARGMEGVAANGSEVAPGEAFVAEPGTSRFASVPADGDSATALVVGEPPVDDVRAHEGA